MSIDRSGMIRRTGEDMQPMEHQAVYERLVQASRARELAAGEIRLGVREHGELDA